LERKINVISRKDIDSLYTKHILHLLELQSYEVRARHFVLDVGTGGGPGIPLAILFQKLVFI
jgi:16S rRNA (guanine527-N7)-methyltransferase